MSDNYELVGSIRRNLVRIRDNYDEALDPVRRASNSKVKTSKEAPLPVPAHILDIRLEAHNDLQYWARFLLDEVRDINGNALTTGPASTGMSDLTTFVALWADWIVTNRPDDADNLATETAKHGLALAGVVEELGSRKFTIGNCPEHDTSELGERTPCAGNLRATLRRDDALLPSEVACTLNPEHRWPAREWMQLGRRIVGEMTG